MEDIPENFSSVMRDFTSDLKTTFPEYASLWWVYGEDTSDDGWKDLYNYCLKIYPERFFDILYQNEEIFSEKSVENVDFLPRVDFKKLYNCDGVSKQTQNTIWKYLQLILFMVVENIKDKSEFGNTMNIFEGVDEEELQKKMSEAMSGLSDFFRSLEENGKKMNSKEGDEFLYEFMEDLEKEISDENAKNDTSSEGEPKQSGIPNPEDIHNHLKGLFGGKLGRLAEELMSELTDDIQNSLGLDPNEFNESSNPADVLKKLMRHPEKLMGLVKKIQNKFQDKMKSGDISQEEIMKEAGDMMRKMKEMGGSSKQMNEMFQNMAKTMGGGMNKNMRVDKNKLDQMFKSQDIRQRMKAKLEKKKQEQMFTLKENGKHKTYTPFEGEKQEKTYMTDQQIEELSKEIEGINEKPIKKKKSKKNNKK